MPIKEHLLKKFLLGGAEHHTRVGKAHMAAASAHDCLDEDTQKIAGGRYHRDLAEAHRRMAEAHGDHAKEHIALYKSLEPSAAGDDIETIRPGGIETHGDSFGSHDFRAAAGTPWAKAQGLDQIRPDNVRGVLPAAPDSSLRLIQRVGGPPIDTEGVDESLKKLLG
jgi:hypothetical protein